MYVIDSVLSALIYVCGLEERLRGSIESVCVMVFFMTTHTEEASEGDKRNQI